MQSYQEWLHPCAAKQWAQGRHCMVCACHPSPGMGGTGWRAAWTTAPAQPAPGWAAQQLTRARTTVKKEQGNAVTGDEQSQTAGKVAVGEAQPAS